MLCTAIIDDYEGKGTILDNDPVTVHGFVFMDLNGNGFFDAGTEYGLSGVQTTITDTNGNHTTITGPTLTDPNGNSQLRAGGPAGQRYGHPNPLTTPANSIITTGSLPLSVLTPFVSNAPHIGFNIPATEFEEPTGSLGESGGANNDTVYGGQGNDVISGGNGDDWLIGGHWTSPIGACDGSPYNVVVSDNQGRRYVDLSLPETRTRRGTKRNRDRARMTTSSTPNGNDVIQGRLRLHHGRRSRGFPSAAMGWTNCSVRRAMTGFMAGMARINCAVVWATTSPDGGGGDERTFTMAMPTKATTRSSKPRSAGMTPLICRKRPAGP